MCIVSKSTPKFDKLNDSIYYENLVTIRNRFVPCPKDNSI